MVNSSLNRRSSGDLDRNPAPEAGAFYLFAQQGADWMLGNFIKGPIAKDSSLLGDRVAMSGDTIMIGAEHDDGSNTSHSGRVYVFR